jgi:glycosyltransferase involved in cell wall biosynthesis
MVMDTPRLRVLRIATRLNIGGPSIHVGELSDGLPADRFETRLVVGRCGTHEGDMTARVTTHRTQLMLLPTLHRPLRPLCDMRAWWQIVRMIRQWQPHIIHTHMAKAGALGRLAAMYVRWTSRKAYTPVVIHTFHGHVLDGYFSRLMTWVFTCVERWLATRSDYLIAVSAAVAHDLSIRGIVAPRPTQVIPLGLPLAHLLAIDGETPSNRSPGTLTVAWVGRLVPIKQAHVFVAACAYVHQHRPDIVLRGLIVGDGVDRQRTEAAIAEQGLTAIVQCMGWAQEMTAVYRDADVVCLTSANEGTPVALIEALAAARPVVATAVGGVVDVLGMTAADSAGLADAPYVAGVGGLLARPGDAAAIGQALIALAQDAAHRKRLGQAGRHRVRGAYASSRLLRDIENLYTAACGMRAQHIAEHPTV